MALKLTTCPACEAQMSTAAKTCLRCGAQMPFRLSRNTFAILAIVLVMLALFVFVQH
jgi:predicted amidophosphoribosyltransferase